MNIFAKTLNIFYLFKQNHKEYLFEIFAFLHVKIYTLLFILLNISSWILAKFIVHEIGAEQMALHYSVDFGIDYYGKVTNIYIIPFLGLLIFLVNFFLYAGIGIRHKDKLFFSHLLFLTAIVANYILLTSVLLVYLVNFK